MKGFKAVVHLIAVGVLTGLTGSVVAQESYPNRPIRIIVPYSPGGAVDILARLVGKRLTESWGQQVIVENRPGGSTIIGADLVAKAAQDGYTYLMTSNTHALIPLMLRTPYDVVKDFAPIATISRTPTIMMVHPSLPAANVKEFIALAKSRPGQLNYASIGSGSVTHLAGELFDILTGVKMQHVPYKGGGPALTDLIGGQVHLFFALPASAMPHIKNGKLKAIAISGEARLVALPQVPTFTEGGLPGFDVMYWQAVLAPSGTPKAIIDKFSAEIARILALPDFKEKLDSLGVDPFISTPEQFAALIRADMTTFARVIKTANIKMEE